MICIMVDPFPNYRTLATNTDSPPSNHSCHRTSVSSTNDKEKSEQMSRSTKNTMPRRRVNASVMQDVLLIWLDNNIDEENKDCRNTIVHCVGSSIISIRLQMKINVSISCPKLKTIRHV